MGLWIGIAVTYVVLVMVLGIIPILGQLLIYFLIPILWAA